MGVEGTRALGVMIDTAPLKNWAALSRTEGGLRLGMLVTRYCRSRHTVDGPENDGGSMLVVVALGSTFMVRDEEAGDGAGGGG